QKRGVDGYSSRYSSRCVVPCDPERDGGDGGGSVDGDPGAKSGGPGAWGDYWVCNPAKKYCSECITDDRCAGSRSHCSEKGWCVECTNDRDCAGAHGGPRCILNICMCG